MLSRISQKKLHKRIESKGKETERWEKTCCDIMTWGNKIQHPQVWNKAYLKKEEVKKYKRKLYGKIHNKTMRGVKMYHFFILKNVWKEVY